MPTKLTYCDGCGKQRRDVRSCGRDSNGDPDAPDLCFLCRVEGERGRVYVSGRGYMSLQQYEFEQMQKLAQEEPPCPITGRLV
jgi:hypothetical protein